MRACIEQENVQEDEKGEDVQEEVCIWPCFQKQ